MIKSSEAYALLRNWDDCSLAVRLECHEAKLRTCHTAGETAQINIIAEAVADVCVAVKMLLGEQAE